jgi:hypothetical protein
VGWAQAVPMPGALPSDEELAVHLTEEGDPTLYRAIAAHIAQDASLLDPDINPAAAIAPRLASAIKALRESASGATSLPPLSEDLGRQIMGSLVVDVERGAGRLFKKLEEQPEIEAAVYQVFNEEVHEDLRGWTGAASATTTISQPDALDDATAAAAAAGKEAKAAGRRDFRVAVIGGGCSGLISAIKLRQAGIDFVVVERNSQVGGVWWQNSYPEAGCDVPSHFYSFSFAPNAGWSKYYSKSSEIHEYCTKVAEHYGVLDAVLFKTKATACSYDESTARWQIDIEASDGSGGNRQLVADVLITACGQLSEPAIPPIPGRESFAGPAAHTAHWDTLDGQWQGKDVAVVGTGASAMQLLRNLVGSGPAGDSNGVAKSVTVFQQVPAWFAPQPKYHQRVEAAEQWRLARIPLYHAYSRFRLYWSGSDGIHAALFPGGENDGFRRSLERGIRRQCEGYVCHTPMHKHTIHPAACMPVCVATQ